MSNLFNLDAPIWAWLTELADIMLVSIYWWICSLPIITLGASTTSLFYVLGKKIRKEPVYITRDFFKSFRDNFRQSVPITIIIIVAWVSSILYVMLGYESLVSGSVSGIMKIVMPLAIVFVFETIHITINVCAVFSRFNMKTYNIFSTAFILVHRHLLTTIIHTVIIAVSMMLLIRLPFFILIMPGAVAGAMSFFIQPIFTKYIEMQQPLEEGVGESAED